MTTLEFSARQTVAEAPPLSDGTVPQVVIKPSKGLFQLHLADLWHYRELLYFLAWRDVKVRYKQTAIGATWAILQPLMTMAIFTAIFGNFAKISSDGLPYPIFAYTALLPWQYFSHAINRSVTSLVGSSNLIRKVYFPRLIIPMAAVVAPLVDFAVAFTILAGMILWYGIRPTWGVFLMPGFLLLALLTALAVGLWLSAMNAKYRDIGHAIPFLVQVWMYASPIAYPVSLVPDHWRPLYSLNPLVGVVEGFRWALLGNVSPGLSVIGISTAMVLALLIGGLIYFKRTERTIGDVI